MGRKWLTEIREESNKPKYEVADFAGITSQYYGMIEAGLRNPSVEIAKKIAEFLNFDWTLFFETNGNKKLQNREVG
ncbi:helix-turn-helix domain-containing protein [Paenibacillus durus]|uniref:XRE family transcriptional regulator n=1 Tax=Paenibacillus durus ATCC 35681 TaxID=1333534 RepID=A0A0F7FBN4_PAEDU|nr:helix-turn-helix transcriptional regulator [Paenibacillus durus]AKG36139.1 XRE family transcriptional regulator [Paenibacillus durus ATCC 35681]